MQRSGLLGSKILVVLAVLGLSSMASAQGTLAVMKFEATGGGEASAGKLSDAVRAEVRKTNMTLSAKGGDITVTDAQLVAECEEMSQQCMDMVCAFLEADQIVFGSVTPTSEAKLSWYVKGKGFEREVEGPAGSPEEAGRLARRLFAGEIGTLVVTSGTEAGAEVVIDGVPAGLTRFEGELTVGQHTVQVRKPLFEDSEVRTITVADGQSQTVDFELVALPEAAMPGRMSTLTTVGWIVSGVGAATLVGGGVTGVLFLGAQEDADKQARACKNGEVAQCNPDILDKRDSAETLGLIATTLYAAGGVATATGIVLVIVGYMDSGSEAETAKAGDMDFAFGVNPDGGASAMFTVRF